MSKPEKKNKVKRSIKIVNLDGTSELYKLRGFTTLPSHMSKSLSLNETKYAGEFHLCVSEALISDMSKVSHIEIIRD